MNHSPPVSEPAQEQCDWTVEGTTCGAMYNCCSCGGVGCGCAYCWDCNACEFCQGAD